jgi:hypothetical protein
LNASVKIKEMDALNTSDHTLVLATVGVDIKRATPSIFLYHMFLVILVSYILVLLLLLFYVTFDLAALF